MQKMGYKSLLCVGKGRTGRKVGVFENTGTGSWMRWFLRPWLERMTVKSIDVINEGIHDHYAEETDEVSEEEVSEDDDDSSDDDETPMELAKAKRVDG